MFLFGVIINKVTLVENTGCKFGSIKLKINCMEVCVKLYLAARGVNSIFLFCTGLLKSTEKKLKYKA